MSPKRATPPKQHKHGLRLSRQLLLWVLVPQIVLWLAGGVATYVLAASYVDQALDNGLLQSSRSLARQLKPLGNGLMVDFPRAAQTVIEADPQDRQYYMVSSPPGKFVLGNRTLPPPPPHIMDSPAPGMPYFYDGQMPLQAASSGPTQRVRAVALYLVLDGEINAAPQRVLVQLARSNNTREQLVQRILVDMLLPLSTLVLLMTFIVWWGIQRGLAPIKALTEQVEGRAPSNLAPLQLDRAPEELHSLAGALNTLLDDAKHHLDAQKRFIGDAAHQLRTPMAGLKSQTELALAQTQDPVLHKRLAHVHESASRCAHLVSQLLTLARAAPEAAPAHLQTLALLPFLQDIVGEWVPKALRHGVDLGWDDGCRDEARVQAEPTLLREAVANVLDNAIRYAGAGAEVTLGLALEKEEGAGFARIWVQDNGPGIAAQDLERVFERFYRGTESGTGCGLGLPIVRDIVQRHGGSVSLQAHAPRGLVVQLRLPLA